MHKLRKPTEIHRALLDKALGATLVQHEDLPPEHVSWARVVRLIVPAGVIVCLSTTQRADDIANGVQSYMWPEVEGPQTNLVFHLRADQELNAVLSNASPAGLAPRLTVIIEYPDNLPE